MFLFYIIFTILFLPITIFFPTKVIGRKNLKKKGRTIIISNHHSNLDPVLLDIKLHKRIRFLSKKELFNNKIKAFFFGFVCGCVPVNRGATDLTATKKILSLLKDEKQIGIFPEGTRNTTTEEMLELKNGVCLFALKTKTPIIPTYLIRKSRFLRRNVLLVGKPFELSEFYNEKFTKDVLLNAGKVVSEKMDELKRLYEEQQLEKQTVNQLKKMKKEQKNDK